MNFLSNLADSIPVVGHVKGIVHYAVGDSEGGNKAMYQATRTSAVLGAGAAGALAGPGGAVVAAMYAGAITDSVASVAMDQPQGLIKGCKNIAEDVKEKKNPLGSIAGMGFQMGMDGLGGLGMGGVSSAASQVSEKAVATGVENIAKNAVKSVGEKTLEKTLKMTGEQVVKKVTKTVTEKAVKKAIETAVVQAEVALVTTHVCMQAGESTKEEDRRRDEEERDKERRRRDRERREREEREQREREQREREERQRREREERQHQEQRAREQQEQRAREQQAQRAREQQAQRAREQQEQCTRERQEHRSTPERNPGSSRPPRRNRRNNSQSRNNEPNFFTIFMDLLEELLNKTFGVERPYTRERVRISQIFEGLSSGQEEYLAKIVKRLYKGGILEDVTKLVIRIFSEHFPEDISFVNFLSLIEFVAVYMLEDIKYRTEVYRSVEMIWRESDRSIVKMEVKELKATIIETIMNLANIVSIIVDIFKDLKVKIENELATCDLSPNFRDIFSAIYHYFKHRSVPGDGELSVSEYYQWIRRVLEELGRQQGYSDLVETQRTTDVMASVEFEIYVVLFGRWIKIVVKFQGRAIVLASCYVRDNTFDGDEEGMVWIEICRF